MRHNDYMVVDQCKVCKAPIMVAKSWTGRIKGSSSCRENVRVPTCVHVVKKRNFES